MSEARGPQAADIRLSKSGESDVLLYYIHMQYSQHKVFPFLHYYPFLFQPCYQPPTGLPSQRPPLSLKRTETNVSLIESWPTLVPQDSPRPPIVPEPAEQLVRRAVAKPRPKNKNKNKKKREEDYSQKKQKKDRNLPSNILKILSSSVYSNEKALEFVRRRCCGGVELEGGEELDPSAIFRKFKSVVKGSQSYVRPGAVQSLYQEGLLTAQESRVFRVFLRRFLLEEFPVIITQQGKLKKSQKVAYIRLARSLQAQLNANFFK